MNIQDVRRRHVQALVDQLWAAGADLDRVTAVVDSLRSIYTYAVQREAVDFSPVVQLTLPEDRLGPPEPVAPAPRAPAPTSQTLRPASLPSPEAATAMIAQAPLQPAPAAATTTMATAPTSPGMSAVADQYYQALTPERVLWWTLLIIVVVAVLIAIVLAAESV